MKNSISGIASLMVVALSIFLLWQFFQDYKIVYIFGAIFIPILLMFFSSEYCANNLIVIIICTFAVGGVFYFDEPINIISGSVAVYLILFKIIRHGSGLSGKYIDVNQLEFHDIEYLKKLLNSEWYRENLDIPEDEVSVESLKEQSFFIDHVKPIVEILIHNNINAFVKSDYKKEDFENVHALALIYTLPRPITKNENGLISTGTQIVVNMFANFKSIQKLNDLEINDKDLLINSLVMLTNKSEKSFGKVTEADFDRIKNAWEP